MYEKEVVQRQCIEHFQHNPKHEEEMEEKDKTNSSKIEDYPAGKVHMSKRTVSATAKQIQGDHQHSNELAPFTGAKHSEPVTGVSPTEQRNNKSEPLRADSGNFAHVTNWDGPASSQLQQPHKPTHTLHQSPPTEQQDHRQVPNKSTYSMLSLKWENNPIQVSEMSTIKVTEKLLNSHLHMVRGAIRTTKLPMIVWVHAWT